jgi:excisionase family DNA binding protein
MEELDAVASLSSPTVEETLDASAGSSVSVDLSPEQSSALYALPLFSMVYGESVPHTLLQLKKAQDHRGMTLQFSLHTQVIPEMMSLKEVCRQLKVGRWTIMQLIRRQELRCYRIAHRYRFTVEDHSCPLKRTGPEARLRGLTPRLPHALYRMLYSRFGGAWEAADTREESGGSGHDR